MVLILILKYENTIAPVPRAFGIITGNAVVGPDPEQGRRQTIKSRRSTAFSGWARNFPNTVCLRSYHQFIVL